MKCDLPFSSSSATNVFKYWLASFASSTLLGLAPAALLVGSIGNCCLLSACLKLALSQGQITSCVTRAASSSPGAAARDGNVDRLIENVAVLAWRRHSFSSGHCSRGHDRAFSSSDSVSSATLAFAGG